MKLSYPQFFEAATGKTPYDWQVRLSEDPVCQSRLIDIPTGLGKTAGVVLAWLWNYLRSQSVTSNNTSPQNAPPWPRRLVYCLPMRTLVEQTEAEVTKWLFRLALSATQERSPERDAVNVVLGKQNESTRDSIHENNWKPESFSSATLSANALRSLLWLVGVETNDSYFIPHPSSFSPIVLMGGEDLSKEKRDWDLYPERPAILIGTQDMLLSRALNRGYGMSRYRWPMHFGLLNNDCLWVMDEVQLMGVGVETSAQLEGLRRHLGTLQNVSTWWMSATLAPERLKTPDFKLKQVSERCIRLSSSDFDAPAVSTRTNAFKRVEFTGLQLSGGKADEVSDYLQKLSTRVLETHEEGSLTLVILNRVNRVQELFALLKQSQSTHHLGLIHSRFRPEERTAHMQLLDNEEGGILVATQAVEAGLDISARHLFTEIAPWSSLVQRFGRCNRNGAQPNGGKIHWIDLKSNDAKQQETLALPYSPGELALARTALQRCSDASPAGLQTFNVSEKPEVRPVLRRKDLLDLFDTTADVAGHDLDISGYIRDGEDTDVEVFWREIPADEAPSPEVPKATSREICRVSISAFRSFLRSDKSKRVWRWQSLTNEWDVVRSAVPGMTFLIASDVGGYTTDLGWTGQHKTSVPAVQTPETDKNEADEDNVHSLQRSSESLSEHTAKVLSVTQAIAKPLLEESTWRDSLEQAARWHDVGKAHYHFQKMLNPEGIPPKDGDDYFAKSASNGRCERKHFRHELASALAWLANPQSTETSERDLIAYLIAAHHGKVRLSIRAMPTEQGPKDNPDRAFARGIWDGETLPHDDWPEVHLCGTKLPSVALNLSILTLGKNYQGEESWLERTLRLRNRPNLGPFRLAFLETLLRSADGRASANKA